jgi:hypothetical protein
MTTPMDERVIAAFAQRLSAGLGLPVERNKPEPPALKKSGDERVILVDGPEPELEHERVTGLRVAKRTVTVEGYVRGEQAGTLANSLRARVIQAALADPTLDGLLYGKWTSGVARRRFTGITEGDFQVEAWREDGVTPGAAFSQTFVLQYATALANPSARPSEAA